MPAFEWLAREHPALVHLPIAASLLLPPTLALSLRRAAWVPASRLLAWAALGGGVAAVFSGLLWARSMDLIPPGAFAPVQPGLASTHEGLALAGLLVGLAALFFIERGKLRAALAAALLWTGLWGAAGHWGGRMVFPEPEAALRSNAPQEAPWAT